jgi:type I protein arginine methyltransferase
MRELREMLDYHGGMLADGARTGGYARAIAETVRPGDVVIDIGTGTGILAMMAARAGARMVYAIEAGPVIELAERVIAANGLQDVITLVQGASFDATLPEPADVLVSEIIWNAGLGEGILDSFADAHERLLKPGARVVPGRLEMWAAPIESEHAHRVVSRWSPDLLGFDYSALRGLAANVGHVRFFRTNVWIAEPAVLGAFDLTQPDPATLFAAEAEFAAARDGLVHGFASWFAAELTPTVRLDNTPPRRGSWMQAYFPVDVPIEIAKGDPIKVRVTVLSDDELWRWSVEAGGRVEKGSTLEPHLQAFRRPA